MRRSRYRQEKGKLAALILIPLVALGIIGVSYSHWQEDLHIDGAIKTGWWKSCIRVQKTLQGAYTDSSTGKDLTVSTDWIAIAASFPTKFKLTIHVKNCGSTTLTNVVVTDRIETNVAPINSTPSEGSTAWFDEPPPGKPGEFMFNYLTWSIGDLDPGESTTLVIWLRTLKNPDGKYAPTEGDEEAKTQDIEINRGATVVADSPLKALSATTKAIMILIGDDNTPGNGIGKILTGLPYSTPWEEDTYP